MARLYRPHIPLDVRAQVAERQMQQFPSLRAGAHMAVDWRGFAARRLKSALTILARGFGCEIKDLRLDHDPPLGARQKRGEGKATVYTPDANDPNHLAYRPHGAEFAGSHDVKTRIRGDHGQYSDIQLIKRERRRQKKADGRPKKKWALRGKLSTKGKARWPKRGFPKKRN